MKTILVISCILSISCAIPINEFPSYNGDAIPEYSIGNGQENIKRVTRQVAVNVGPVGVGVSPFGGVGVRVGPFIGVDVPPSFPVAYPAAAYPAAYPAAIPLAYSAAYPRYEYRGRYRYRFF